MHHTDVPMVHLAVRHSIVTQKVTLIDMAIPYTVCLYDSFTRAIICSCLITYYMSSVEWDLVVFESGIFLYSVIVPPHIHIICNKFDLVYSFIHSFSAHTDCPSLGISELNKRICHYNRYSTLCNFTSYLYYNFNPLKTKRRLLYLKTHSMPCSKHFASWL